MQEIPPSSVAREIWRLAVQVAMDSADRWNDHDLRHEALPPDLALQLFRRRLAALQRGMTQRELDVCARTLIGLTAEGIAIDLNIKKTSVLTYRKRAYARLGISSQTQLFRLLA
jgi:DNA-binding CsgD family transcriptional regulator